MATSLERLRVAVDDQAGATLGRAAEQGKTTINQRIVWVLERINRELDELREALAQERVDRQQSEEKMDNRVYMLQQVAEQARDLASDIDRGMP